MSVLKDCVGLDNGLLAALPAALKVAKGAFAQLTGFAKIALVEFEKATNFWVSETKQQIDAHPAVHQACVEDLAAKKLACATLEAEIASTTANIAECEKTTAETKEQAKENAAQLRKHPKNVAKAEQELAAIAARVDEWKQVCEAALFLTHRGKDEEGDQIMEDGSAVAEEEMMEEQVESQTSD